jgi:hypothetical protein
MLRKYLATYEYTETVQGKARSFVHESIIEAASDQDAHAAALDYFDAMSRVSGVGWRRALDRCAVTPAPKGAMAKGGRRVEIEGGY